MPYLYYNKLLLNSVTACIMQRVYIWIDRRYNYTDGRYNYTDRRYNYTDGKTRTVSDSQDLSSLRMLVVVGFPMYIIKTSWSLNNK